jgi:hypothetical protein
MLTTRPDKVCLSPGCGATGDWDRGYCPDHTGRGTAQRVDKTLEKLYHTAAYQRFRSRLMSMNPICQRLTFGRQCNKPGKQLHHLADPHAVQAFYDARNCVMLCNEHHPGGKAGTPSWVEGRDYAATEWREPSFG